jgi:hypothetical protein
MSLRSIMATFLNYIKYGKIAPEPIAIIAEKSTAATAYLLPDMGSDKRGAVSIWRRHGGVLYGNEIC